MEAATHNKVWAGATVTLATQPYRTPSHLGRDCDIDCTVGCEPPYGVITFGIYYNIPWLYCRRSADLALSPEDCSQSLLVEVVLEPQGLGKVPTRLGHRVRSQCSGDVPNKV